jgi:hypothetical protein
LFICAICSSYSKSVPVHEVDHQPPAGLGPQIRQVAAGLLDHRDALIDAEHAGLLGVGEHGDDHLVELRGGPLEHVDVPQRHRIEGARADSATHARTR